MADMNTPRGGGRVKHSVSSYIYTIRKAVGTVLRCLPCRAMPRCSRPPWCLLLLNTGYPGRPFFARPVPIPIACAATYAHAKLLRLLAFTCLPVFHLSHCILPFLHQHTVT